MCAARNNRLSVVNFLLDTIDDVGLDAFDTDHQTALHHAAFAGHTHVVRRLVHAGANTSTTNKVKSPLQKKKNKKNILKALHTFPYYANTSLPKKKKPFLRNAQILESR